MLNCIYALILHIYVRPKKNERSEHIQQQMMTKCTPVFKHGYTVTTTMDALFYLFFVLFFHHFSRSSVQDENNINRLQWTWTVPFWTLTSLTYKCMCVLYMWMCGGHPTKPHWLLYKYIHTYLFSIIASEPLNRWAQKVRITHVKRKKC